MPHYNSEDDNFNDDSFANKPGIIDNPPDQEFEDYIESFFTYIHHTKCSLCNSKKPTLPVHLPFFRKEIFICSACLYIVYEQLATFGYYEQIQEKEIIEGRVRERGGDIVPVEYLNVTSELAKKSDNPMTQVEINSKNKNNLISDSEKYFAQISQHEELKILYEKLDPVIRQYIEKIGDRIIQQANVLNISIEESILAVNVILETMKKFYDNL